MVNSLDIIEHKMKHGATEKERVEAQSKFGVFSALHVTDFKKKKQY